MSSYQPNAEFCARAGLPYPAPRNIWDPEEFTFRGLEKTLTQMLDGDTAVLDPNTIRKLIISESYKMFDNQRLACVIIPVCFSPSNALKMAEALKNVEYAARKKIHATFLFGTGLSYNTAEPRTREAIATLANMGHDIGLLVTLDANTDAKAIERKIDADLEQIQGWAGKRVHTMGFHSLGIRPGRTIALADEIEHHLHRNDLVSLHSRFFHEPDIAICATQAGFYKKGHPADLFGPDKKIAVLQLSEAWYASSAVTPIERLWNLPEVRDADTKGRNIGREYQDRLGRPIYGASYTYENVNPQISGAYRAPAPHKHNKQMS